MKMKCIIVDDEELAREGLEDHLRQIEILEISGSCGSVAEAHALLMRGEVDLMFLDIELPVMNGLDFLESLRYPPITILITAWANHALEGFRLGVMDYLLKPVIPLRLMQSVNKAWEYFLLRKQSEVSDHIFIRHSQLYEKVMLADILYIEGMQNYVVVHTPSRKMITHLTFKLLQESLPSRNFLRIHKSFIINLDHVTAVENNMVRIGEVAITVGAAQRAAFMEQVVYRKLLSK